MERIKKGTASKRTAPKHTHTYLNRIKNTCLILFGVYLILFYAGCFLKVETLQYIGIGIGISITAIICGLYLKED